ncbi:MAG: PTS glucose transporter subunit IIA [Clostridia bacterium]|nr:PTS glucose transporter subunit IIA [Clostridia bacterium]
MALDYRKCAEEIAANIGGGSNVISAAHCATRLRLVIADNSKVNKKVLENVDGVKGLFESNGQLQLIIGTGTVNKVYDEFLSVTGASAATKDDVKAAAASKMPWWKKILKTPGDVFVPILPAIVASGLMMGLVEAIPKFWPAFGDTDWYSFLDLVANTAFALLPVLVAISSARVFGGNIFLGAVIGLMMVHPALINAWTVGNCAAGEIPTWNLWFFNVQQVGYQGHVIPVILAVLLMSKLEKGLHKIVPEMIDLFVTPLVTVLVTSFVTFTVIGPIFSILENYVLEGAKWLASFSIGAIVMGAIYPWTVVMGLHHMYNVIEAGMIAQTGLNTWMPIASAANFAQFGACLAVALKVKNQKTKSVAFPSSLSASLGITEPAIFGINFRFMKPFLCGMAGGAVGALFGALFGLGAPVYGVTGIPAIPAVNNVPLYLVELIISAGVAFALVWTLWKEEQPEAEAAAPAAPAIEVPTVSVIRCAAGQVLQPVKGTVIAREQIPDDTFASGVLGDGVGIQPADDKVVAPFDGTISSVAESQHAVGIECNGMEMLIHVGVDTVNMKGDGFTCLVKEGDAVKAGQPLIIFDRAKIKAAGYSDTVAVLLTNSDDLEGVECGAK